MTTGMIMPLWSFVAALNSLQKAIMSTPCWPKAGPTGGAGFAWPAGICSLICPVTFFAIKIACRGDRALRLLDLPILDFHRRVAAKNVDRHVQFALLRIDLLDHTAEIKKWAVIDLDGFADFKADLRTLGVLRFRNLRLDHRHFLGRNGDRTFAAHESDFSRCILYKIPRLFQNPFVFIEQHHVDVKLAGMQFAGGDGFLAAAHIHNLLDRDEDL